MQTITLSDHTAAKINQYRIDRLANDQKAFAEFEMATAAHHARRDALRQAIRDAWRNRHFGTLLLGLGNLAAVSLLSAPKCRLQQHVSAEEFKWKSGNEGEALVRSELAAAFGDDWTLISGYKNRKGEIDLVLVGHLGVFAIEVKFINGHVTIDGDRWSRDKYDHWGNLKEVALPIADRRGRSPSRQLNDATDLLHKFLEQSTNLRRIYRIVVLSHHRSVLAGVRNLTIDGVVLAQDMAQKLRAAGMPRLDDAECRRIVAKIQRDHKFHDGKEKMVRTCSQEAPTL